MSILLCDNITNKKGNIKSFQFNFLEKLTYGIIDYSNKTVADLFDTLTSGKNLKNGTVWVDGHNIALNKNVKNKISYISDDVNFHFKTCNKIFKYMSKKYPKWDMYYAYECATLLNVPTNKPWAFLSKENREVIIGICTLCSKANISFYFEPLFSTNEKKRNLFFALMNAHKAKYPRTNIIFSKRLDSIDILLDKILFFDDCKLISVFTNEQLKENFTFLTGKEEILKPLVKDLSIIGTEKNNFSLSICTSKALTKDEIRKFQKYQIEISPVSIQKIYSYFLALRENRSSTIESIYSK